MVTATQPCTVTFRLPEAFHERDVEVAQILPVAEGPSSPKPLPASAVEHDTEANTLSVEVPSFQYYVIIVIT